MAKPELQKDLTLLMRHLEGMIRQFKDLANLLLQERQVVKQRKAEELETISRLVQLALDGIHDGDEQRRVLTTRMGQALGLKGEGVSLTELDQALGGDSGLLPLRDQLREVITHSDKLNKENHAILQGVEKATEALLAIFKKSAQTGESYNRLGGRRAGSALNLYSRRL